MSRSVSLDDLWNSAPISERPFDSARVSGFPEAAGRYLEHAIASGAPLASTVRLRMHGEIKLGGWHRFSAEEVIHWGRGMIWRARVLMRGMPIRGGDSFVVGQGSMRWKLFGIIPIVNASGPDISRSAAGRMNVESIWLPAVLCGDEVSWTATDPFHLHCQFTAHGEAAEIDYTIDEKGRLKTVSMPRWGNPDGATFHYASCGGFVEEEGAFAGYTISTRMRVGWHFGAGRFEPEREFFRVTIDDAVYR